VSDASSDKSAAPWLRLTISPEPYGDEGEALVAAIAAFLAFETTEFAVDEPEVPASRWLTAGRRESIQGRAGAAGMGWARVRPGWR
jgi:hypothetical protein